jgi:hypothetical protein
LSIAFQEKCVHEKVQGTSIKNKIIYGTVATIVIVSLIGKILSMEDIKALLEKSIQHVRAVRLWGNCSCPDIKKLGKNLFNMEEVKKY